MLVCLRQDLLRPGDVLLVRATGLEAVGVSLSHPSRFSHAAMFVDRSHLFEADDHGVGAAAPAVIEAPRHGPLVVLPQVVDARVLRHPGLAGLEPGSIAEADLSLMLGAIVDRKVQPYSRLGRLSKAAGPLEGVASVVLEAMDFHQALHRPSGSSRRRHDEGRFCSEIVCKVLEELGYPAFQDGRPHAEVGPGHLTESTMVDVTGRVAVQSCAEGLGVDARMLEAAMDAYWDRRSQLMLRVEQELAARREEERLTAALSEPIDHSRVDRVRTRVDEYRQVVDEVQAYYRQHRLERHAAAAERVREMLAGFSSGERGVRVVRAAREVARLAAEYELLRIRAAASALKRVGDAVGSERLTRRAERLERWTRA